MIAEPLSPEITELLRLHLRTVKKIRLLTNRIEKLERELSKERKSERETFYQKQLDLVKTEQRKFNRKRLAVIKDTIGKINE